MRGKHKFLFYGGEVVWVINGRITSPTSINLIDAAEGRSMVVEQSKRSFLHHLMQIDPDTFLDMMEVLDSNSEDFILSSIICKENSNPGPTNLEEEYNP